LVIDGTCFAESGIRRIEIEAGNPHFEAKDDFLIDLRDLGIVRYFGRDVEVTIPDYARGLVKSSFAMCDRIRIVHFAAESKVSWIGTEAFEFCESLESITFPPSLESLERSCFSGCCHLTDVTFPPDSTLKRIGKAAFHGCEALQSLVLPSSLEHIGIGCFGDCRSLADLTFLQPAHLTELCCLPPIWPGLHEIPDSVEALRFLRAPMGACKYALSFGKDSRLKEVKAEQATTRLCGRAFLRVASSSLKVFRSTHEFRSGSAKATDERGTGDCGR
jgi:hypothetical protein